MKYNIKYQAKFKLNYASFQKGEHVNFVSFAKLGVVYGRHMENNMIKEEQKIERKWKRI